MFGNENGGGYDTVALGSVEPLKVDLDALEARLARPDNARAVQSLQVVGFGSLQSLFGTYAGSRTELDPWLQGAEINRDGNLRLQYLAGMALNVSMEGTIYNQMLRYRRFPRNVFVGSEERVRNMMYAIGAN